MRRASSCRAVKPAAAAGVHRALAASASPSPELRTLPAIKSKRATSTPQPPAGVSAAFLITHLLESPAAEPRSTRCAAAALKQRLLEDETRGPYVQLLEGEVHEVSEGPLAGAARTHVAHAWDADFPGLVRCLADDARGDLDRRYDVDVFTADLHDGPSDPVAEVEARVAGSREVLLVLDGEALALRRLWVLFEALLATDAGKLRVRCCEPGGFGATQAALQAWERRIDEADWVLAQTTRKGDEKRLRAFAERTWELCGKGVERLLAQLKRQLRREVYEAILVAAVEAGDRRAVEAALDLGANPEAKDVLGNTVEELANFNSRGDIEELLFERRMRGRSHQVLSAFFQPQELAAAQEAADPSVLTPFITATLEEDEEEVDEGLDAGELDYEFVYTPCTDAPLSHRGLRHCGSLQAVGR